MTLTDDDRWLLRYLAEHCASPDQSGAITIDRDWQQPGEARTQHSKAIATTLSLTYDQLEALVSRLRQFGLLERQRTSTSLDIWITAQGQDVAWEPVSDPQTSLTYSKTKGGGMDVLISWSKSQSREIATVFHQWIPKVLPRVTPWMSDKDIDKGTDWWDELKGLLTRAKMCIICVTEQNVRSPWLYFETGAIAGKGEGVRVCPYLLGIGPAMLSDGPFGKYQCTVATKEETLSLIRSLNRALDESKQHDEGLLEGNFETKWTEFEAELQRVLTMDTGDPDEFVTSDADEIAGYNLSSEARTLLVETSKDVSGTVQVIRSDAGIFVFTNGRTFGDEGQPKSQALWKEALDDLGRHGLIEPSDRDGVMFRITANGFRVVDALAGNAALD